MNPKEWQKSLKEYLQQLPLSPEVLEKLYEDLSRRTSRLLEAVAVACEGDRDVYDDDIDQRNDKYRIEGFNKGLDAAANLIRSLKNHE